MANHLMVDLETLAVSSRAVVLSLGAVKFDPWGSGYREELYLRFNLDDQHNLGREVDPNTLDWWAKQDPKIMEEAFNPNDRVELVDAVNKFHKFAWGCDAFWSHGATFDLVIIEDLYRQLKKPLPWNYWQLRDTRTIFDLGWDPGMPKESKHDALQDAIRQVVGVQTVLSKIQSNKREIK